MAAVKGLPIFIASLNLAGSLLSLLGSGFVILCYLLLPTKHHFRHVLILNLAVADFFNALDLSVSGFFIVCLRRDLSAGSACTANGFICQLTVQGTDCAIFAITIITVYTITRSRMLSSLNGNWSAITIVLLAAAIWSMPLTTSFIALGMNWYGPASGSWCWLVQSPKYVRYVLTHGWRFLFIVIEIGLYTYLHFYLRRHYRELAKLMDPEEGCRISPNELAVECSEAPCESSDTKLSLPPSLPTIPSPKEKTAFVITENSDRRESKFTQPAQPQVHHGQCPRHKSIQRILLLNAYPLAYIILWIPGIANRLIEASGHTSSVMQVMQASTQFVGLANALTYGWNEGIARQLRRKYSEGRS